VNHAQQDVESEALGCLDGRGNRVDIDNMPLLVQGSSFVMLGQADWRVGFRQSADAISD